MAWAMLERGERKQALVALVAVILSALASAAMVASVLPFLGVLSDPDRIKTDNRLRWLYEYFGFESTYTFLVALGAGSFLVTLVATILQILRVYLLSDFTMMRMHSLSYRLLENYLRQPYAFFRDSHSGDMGTQILNETQQVVSQFLRPASNIIASIFSVLTLIGLLFWVNPLVTLSSFAVFGAVYGGTYYFSHSRLRRLGSLRVETNKARFRIATEALSGIKDITLLAREKAYLNRFEKPSYDMARTQVLATVFGEMPSYVLQGIAMGGILILSLALLNPEAIDKGAALAEIVPILGLFAFAGLRLIPELQKLYLGLTQAQFAAAAVHAIHRDLFGLKDGKALPDRPPEPLGLHHELTLSGVTYRFSKTGQAGLSDVTLTIRAGSKIGIVGTTGSGKTTFADLLLGLNRPQSGKIRVDGTELSDANIRQWQSSIGYVPQDIFLIDATIAENVALGEDRNAINMDRLIYACRVAQLDIFVEKQLEHGYETAVGERGVKLSGGQRQRVGIARALYHNASFFVFDEATSALDNVTEQDVMKSINALPGDKTIVIIAHRLSTVKACDEIIVLDNGSVIGQGSWDELIASNDAFMRLTESSSSPSS